MEQELIEQDALSNAFQTIIKSQDRDNNKVPPRNKPTTLSLISSHSIKIQKHSNDCDINNTTYEPFLANNCKYLDKKPIYNQNSKVSETLKNTLHNEPSIEKNTDPAYSPDSLITDDPSSSSDYLSAAYTYSPAVGSSGCLPQLNAGDDSIKMENIFTSSDSGLENTGLLESLNSHKDVTLTDISLTESTLHDLTIEEGSSLEVDINQGQRIRIPIVRTIPLSICTTSQGIEYIDLRNNADTISNDEACGKSSKEQKQRQNEEIVILESSSVSSETGSWEPVFPPKMTDKEICQKFIQNECQSGSQNIPFIEQNKQDDQSDSPNFLVKTTPCFIDAASLVDEEYVSLNRLNQLEKINIKIKANNTPLPSKPVPFSSIKGVDTSPVDWSESNDNDDSLEQPDNKEPDSIQKDSPATIFEMTLITEDSLGANDIQENKNIFGTNNCETDKATSVSTSTVYMGTTPHNSIMSLKATSLKNYESEESESDAIAMSRESLTNLRPNRYNETSASVENINSSRIESQNSSPLIRRKLDNISITTEVCLNVENNSFPKSSNSVSASAWVVDMSLCPKVSEATKSSRSSQNINVKKLSDKVYENLKNEPKSSSGDSCNKSRSSVDSDSSEKSGHKFYIDLSSLPDPAPPEKTNVENNTHKKNIFSMYIDLGEKSTLKEMPSRLSSSLNAKKQSSDKNSLKAAQISKVPKTMSNEKSVSVSGKCHDTIRI